MTFLLILDMVCIFYHSYLCDCQSLWLSASLLACLPRQFCFTSMKWETETSLCVKVSSFPFYFNLNYVLKTTLFFALFGYKCQFGLIKIVPELPIARSSLADATRADDARRTMFWNRSHVTTHFVLLLTLYIIKRLNHYTHSYLSISVKQLNYS